MSLSGEFPSAVEDSPSALLTLQVGRKEWGGGSEGKKGRIMHVMTYQLLGVGRRDYVKQEVHY